MLTQDNADLVSGFGLACWKLKHCLGAQLKRVLMICLVLPLRAFPNIDCQADYAFAGAL